MPIATTIAKRMCPGIQYGGISDRPVASEVGWAWRFLADMRFWSQCAGKVWLYRNPVCQLKQMWQAKRFHNKYACSSQREPKEMVNCRENCLVITCRSGIWILEQIDRFRTIFAQLYMFWVIFASKSIRFFKIAIPDSGTLRRNHLQNWSV